MTKKRYLYLSSLINLDHDYLKLKLTTMASKGWILTHVGKVFLTLTHQTPQNLNYEIDYLPQADSLVGQDDPIIMNYKTLCEESGWQYVGHNYPFFIFCAPKSAEVTPLQTDLELKNKMMISLILKRNILSFCFPCIPLLMNGLNFNNHWSYLTYSSNIMILIQLGFLIFYPIYIILNILQILVLKFNFDNYLTRKLPQLLRLTSQSIIYLLLPLLIVGLLFMLFENGVTPLSRATLLMLLLYVPIGIGIMKYIQSHQFSRKKNIFIVMLSSLIAAFILTHLMILAIAADSQISQQPTILSDLPIIRISDLDPSITLTYDDYQVESSSFIFSQRYHLSQTTSISQQYSFESYHFRSSFLKHHISSLILQEYETSYQYIEVNPSISNSYFIFSTETDSIIGLIIYDSSTFYILQSNYLDFESPILQQTILLLLSDLDKD